MKSSTAMSSSLQPLDDDAALAWLRAQPDGRTTLTAAALARRWGWPEHRARRRLDTWQKAGHIRRRGRVVTAVGETVGRTAPEPVRNGVGPTVGNPAQPIDDPWKNNRSVRLAAQAAAQAVQLIEFPAIRRFAEQSDQQPDSTAPVGVMSRSPKAEPAPSPANHMPTPKRIAPAQPSRHSLSVADAMAYLVAAGLAGCAAWFSLKGLTVLFPGAPREIVVMGACMEAAKLVACGWLAGAWRQVSWAFRGALMMLIAGLGVINAAGTFSQLTAAHVGDTALTAGAHDMGAVDIDSRLEIAAAKLSDLDKQIGSIDAIVAGAAAKGRAAAAQAALVDQKKARAVLAGEREKAAAAVAALKTERAGVKERTRIAESEAAPIIYAAEVIGIGTDPERAIRWLIALLVCCLDPMALVLTAAVSARRST